MIVGLNLIFGLAAGTDFMLDFINFKTARWLPIQGAQRITQAAVANFNAARRVTHPRAVATIQFGSVYLHLR